MKIRQFAGNKSILVNWLPIIPAVMAPVIIFRDVIFSGRIIFWGLPTLQFIPWRAYAWEMIRQGEIPLWNSLNGMGAPLIGNYQSALFYPPGWILFFLQEVGGIPWMAWGFSLLSVAHIIWAGIGVSRLAKSLGLSELSQAVCGLAFSCCGYLIARASFYSIIWAISWLPWILLFTKNLYYSEGSPRFYKRISIKLIVCLSMQLLTGHAQLTWYTWILAAFWVLGWGWHNHGKKQAIFSLTALIVSVLAAGFLTSIQLLPTFDLLLQSQRSTAVNLETALTYSFWPWRFLTFLAPDLFGNPGLGDYWGYATYWEDAVYFGLLPFLLALFTLYSLKKSRRKLLSADQQFLIPCLWLLVVLAIPLALGKNTPFFSFLFQYVPTFSMFNSPSRFMIWAEFGLIILGGIGLDLWRRPAGKTLYWTRLATAGFFAVTLAAFLLWITGTGIKQSFIRSTAFIGLWGLGFGILTLLNPRPDIVGGGKEKIWSIAVVLWVAFDLFSASWYLNPLIGKEMLSAQQGQSYQSIFQNHSRLYLSSKDEYELKFNRYFVFKSFVIPEDWKNIRTTLLPNLNLIENIPTINNFEPMLDGRYKKFMDQLEKMNEVQKMQWLKWMGVGVVESLDKNQAGGVKFDTIKDAQRFHWAGCAQFAADEQDALNKLAEKFKGTEEKYQNQIILENGTELFLGNCDETPEANLRILYDQPQFIVISLSTPMDGWLAIADTWASGWSASVDDESTPILRANYLFKAIPIKKGDHIIILRYHSTWFQVGFIISIISFTAIIIWGCLILLDKRAKK